MYGRGTLSRGGEDEWLVILKRIRVGGGGFGHVLLFV